MNWLGYCRSGTEQAVQEAILSIASDTVQAFAPVKIEAKRRGKQRRPEPVESPVLPRAIWIRGTAADFHALHRPDVLRAGLSPTLMAFPDASWSAHVAPWLDDCAAEYAAIKRRIEAGERIEQYTRGDVLEIADGPFADRAARFLHMVERSHDLHPYIRVEADMMGRAVQMDVDPLDVRKKT